MATKGKQRYLSNKDNVLREADLSVSVVATATDTSRLVPGDRAGSGVVALSGAYTGAVEATFEIEITDEGVGAAPQASAPAFAGAGSGSMTGVSIDAATDPQDFTVTLREAAMAERDAQGQVGGLAISARADEGEDGNGTQVRVDHAALVFVDSGRLVPEQKVAGTIETSGPAWDFGAMPLTADGNLNPATARIRFGDDPQVYRQYSVQRNGFTVFRFSPALVREIRADAKVWRYVSGARKVTITVGQPTDRFAVVTTPALAGNIRALANDGDLKWVGVSDGGQIAFSDDGGETWAVASSEPFSGAINAVCYVPAVDRFVAGGASGAMAYSNDGGDTWTSVTSGFGSDAIYGLAAGDGKVIAVGVSGKISRSTDNGATWTLQSSSALSDKDILCVAFVLDHFIAGAKDGVLGYSDADGAVWTNFASSPISSGVDVTAIAFDAGRRRLLLGASSGEVDYSDDLGATWTEADTPHLGDAVVGIAQACGIFAVIDDTGRISISGDMLTWSAITTAPLDEGTAIAGSAAGVFVAADNDEFARAVLARTIEDVLTQYDFLYGVYAQSDLLAALLHPVSDERPGGQAALEFQPSTGSIAWRVEPSRGDMASLLSLAVADEAVTQEVEIVCVDDSTPGSEEWEVRTALGIGTAVTGETYHDSTLSFEIPAGTYAEGEQYLVQVLAGAQVVLAGGADAIADNTWSVEGSLSGPLPDYAQAPTPVAYDDEVNFTIEHGDVAFKVGDRFTFSAEGGKFRWRKGSGSWSSEADITSAPVALSDGLSAVFTRAVPPSFVEDDVYEFIVRQPYGVPNLRRPSPEQFKWTSGAVAVVADLGGATTIDLVVLARHSIPSDAVVTVSGSNDNFATTLWSETLTWRSGVMAHNLSVPRTQYHLKLTVDQPAAIGWWAAFEPDTGRITPDADRIVLKRRYVMRHGPLTGGFVGKGYGGEITYQGFISQADADELLAIMDWAKEHGSEPVGLLPHVEHVEDAALVQFDQSDEFEIEDLYQYQSDQRTDRNFSAPTIKLAAVLE